MYKYAIGVILVLLSLDAISEGNFTISSGEYGTPYYEVAQEIKGYIEKVIPSTHVYVSESSGSVENMSRLKKGLTDLVISQQDIALDYYYNEENHFSNFEVVLPLFPEALQIVVTGSKTTLPFGKLVGLIKSKEVNSMFVGSQGGATHILIESIFSIFGVGLHDDFFQFGSVSKAKLGVKNSTIDVFAYISGFPSLIIQDVLKHGSLVTFEKQDMAYILSHISGISSIGIGHDVYSNKNTKDISTIGTWALLLANSDFSIAGPNGESIAEVVLSQLVKSGSNSTLARNYLGNDERSYDAIEGQLTFSEEAFIEIFRGLELSDGLSSLFVKDRSAYMWFLLFALPFLYWFRKTGKTKFEFDIFWLRYKHFIFALGFIIGIYFVLAHLILYFERQLSLISGLKNGFDEVNLFDVHRWLLIFSFTGYNGTLFPQSVPGQMLATISNFLGALAAVLAIVGEFVFNIRNRKRRSGTMSVDYEGHIVICGWNDRVPSLVDKAISAQIDHFGKFKVNIVVVAEKFSSVLEENEEVQAYFDRHQLDFVSGKARDITALKKANIDRARTVILVSEDRDIEADERTLLSALSISRYCREVSENNAIDSIYMIAEINHEEMRSSLINADVNEVVNIADIGESIVVQSMFNHGVSTAITNMVTYNEFNEFNVIDVSKMPLLVGKRYDEALLDLRKHNVLLVSIKICIEDHSGIPIIDSRLIDSELKRIGLSRQIITNPVDEQENSYIIQSKDQLIVLCSSTEDIESMVAA